MIGSYMSSKNSPFIILKNSFFQNAFAGMLDWESYIRNDLISFIKITKPEENIVDANPNEFEDSVVSNVDTRILRNKSGEIILTYAFADQETIVITTTLDSLKFILEKLLAVKVIQ